MYFQEQVLLYFVETLLEIVPRGLINNTKVLGQIMAERRNMGQAIMMS